MCYVTASPAPSQVRGFCDPPSPEPLSNAGFPGQFATFPARSWLVKTDDLIPRPHHSVWSLCQPSQGAWQPRSPGNCPDGWHLRNLPGCWSLAERQAFYLVWFQLVGHQGCSLLSEHFKPYDVRAGGCPHRAGCAVPARKQDLPLPSAQLRGPVFRWKYTNVQPGGGHWGAPIETCHVHIAVPEIPPLEIYATENREQAHELT